MKVLLDTNVLVSGTFWIGNSAEIIGLIDTGKFELILSEEIIDEYNDVVNRDEIIDKVYDKGLAINKSVQKVITNSIIVYPIERFNIIKDDPDDNMILECAVEGNADFIITQDNHLLKMKEFRGIKIITTSEFLNIS